MTTTIVEKNEKTATELEGRRLERLLRESYGPGAWHGPDLKAAVADVDQEAAYWRPKKGAHNIAEIAVHHAYYVHAVRGKLEGKAPEPFPLAGEDWFEQSSGGGLGWKAIQDLLEGQQTRLAELVARIGAGKSRSPLSEQERLDLVLGITCHGVYHAGQIQLLKRLRKG